MLSCFKTSFKDKVLPIIRGISLDENKEGQIEGDKLIYDLQSKTWKVMKKSSDNNSEIKERVKTILKTRNKK